jgi:hypothetical protein
MKFVKLWVNDIIDNSAGRGFRQKNLQRKESHICEGYLCYVLNRQHNRPITDP